MLKQILDGLSRWRVVEHAKEMAVRGGRASALWRFRARLSKDLVLDERLSVHFSGCSNGENGPRSGASGVRNAIVLFIGRCQGVGAWKSFMSAAVWGIFAVSIAASDVIAKPRKELFNRVDIPSLDSQAICKSDNDFVLLMGQLPYGAKGNNFQKLSFHSTTDLGPSARIVVPKGLVGFEVAFNAILYYKRKSLYLNCEIVNSYSINPKWFGYRITQRETIPGQDDRGFSDSYNIFNSSGCDDPYHCDFLMLCMHFEFIDRVRQELAPACTAAVYRVEPAGAFPLLTTGNLNWAVVFKNVLVAYSAREIIAILDINGKVKWLHPDAFALTPSEVREINDNEKIEAELGWCRERLRTRRDPSTTRLDMFCAGLHREFLLKRIHQIRGS